MRLEPLFRPMSIAVVGASEKPTIGRRLISSLDRFGFAGSVFPVGPIHATGLDRTCGVGIAGRTTGPA